MDERFKTGITGAELLKVGTQVAEDAGHRWPDNWQIEMRGEWEDINPAVTALSLGTKYIYRINPDRFKPKKPEILKAPTVCIHGNYLSLMSDYIQITDEVRHRLGPDAGVNRDLIRDALFKWRQIEVLSGDELVDAIMELIAGAGIEIGEE